jgi:hypothetical protein
MGARDGDLAAALADFKKLDKRISKVATSAVRIGDNLESGAFSVVRDGGGSQSWHTPTI